MSKRHNIRDYPGSRRQMVLAVMALVCMLVLFCGCADPAGRLQERISSLNSTRLKIAVKDNLAAVGGLDTWSQVESLEAQVVATIFDSDVGRLLIAQRHTLENSKEFLFRVESFEARGTFTESLDGKGRVTVETGSDRELEQSFAVGVKLLLESRALTGMLYFLNEGTPLQYLELERKGGTVHHKIRASGDFLYRQTEEDPVDDVLVIWIDEENSLIDRIWFRYQKPDDPEAYGYMAVRVTDYRTIELGRGQSLTLPYRLEFVPGDEQQQFSRRRILQLEVRDYQVRVKRQEKLS